MKINQKKLEKSQVEVEFELEAEEFSKYIDKALEKLKGVVTLDGFRKGKMPNSLVEEKVGKESVLMEAGDIAVKESYTKYVTENNLEPVSQPEVQIKKIAKGDAFLFTVKIEILPEITLPEYKTAISKIKGQEIAVTPEEVEEAIVYLQKSRAKFSQLDKGAEKKDFVEIEYQNEHINQGKVIKDRFVLGDGGFQAGFEDSIVGMKAEENKEFASKFPENHPDKNLAGKDAKFQVKMLSVQKMELPELNDEFAKSLGAFDTLVALKENIKEGVFMEKKDSEKQRRRSEILESIAKDTKLEVPEAMVTFEQQRLFENLKNQITQNFKITFEEYLTSVKKTEEEIKQSYRLEAEKRIKSFLVLRQISKQEKVEISNEEVQEEMNRVLRNHTKEQTDKIDINQFKEYTKDTLINEKIFQILEDLT